MFGGAHIQGLRGFRTCTLAVAVVMAASFAFMVQPASASSSRDVYEIIDLNPTTTTTSAPTTTAAPSTTTTAAPTTTTTTETPEEPADDQGAVDSPTPGDPGSPTGSVIGQGDTEPMGAAPSNEAAAGPTESGGSIPRAAMIAIAMVLLGVVIAGLVVGVTKFMQRSDSASLYQ